MVSWNAPICTEPLKWTVGSAERTAPPVDAECGVHDAHVVDAQRWRALLGHS
jgi:hypothetical protein